LNGIALGSPAPLGPTKHTPQPTPNHHAARNEIARTVLVASADVDVKKRSKSALLAVCLGAGHGSLADLLFGLLTLLKLQDASKLFNSTVRCVHPSGCQVGVLGKGAFEAMLRAQPELLDVFEETMRRRNRKRLRSMIELAVERSQCETRTLRAGEVLFAQGEAAEAFFVVDSGCVQMAFTTSDGRQLPSRTHHMGDIFGASGLLAGDGTRRDTATALEHTVLKAIPHARVTTLMRQDSQLAEGLRRATTFSALNGVQGSAAERRGRKLREAPAWSGYAFVGKHPSREQAR